MIESEAYKKFSKTNIKFFQLKNANIGFYINRDTKI